MTAPELAVLSPLLFLLNPNFMIFEITVHLVPFNLFLALKNLGIYTRFGEFDEVPNKGPKNINFGLPG